MGSASFRDLRFLGPGWVDQGIRRTADLEHKFVHVEVDQIGK